MVDHVGTAVVEVTIEAEVGAEGALDAISVGDVEFDTLSAAVAAVLPDAQVVSVIDARHQATDIADDFADAAEPLSLDESFREWLAGPGRGSLLQGEQPADPERVAALFLECHSAVITDAVPEPKEALELETLAGVSEGDA